MVNQPRARTHRVRREVMAAVTCLLAALAVLGFGPPVEAAPPSPGAPLYVTNFNNNSVTAYSAAAVGDAAPLVTIAGPATGLDGPLQIAFDSGGRLYVANTLSDTITVYPPGANGNVAPVATIAGPSTGLSGPSGVAVDADDTLYVTNVGPPGGPPVSTVTVYLAGATGDVAPIATIAGPDTGLRRPTAVGVDGAGRIYVGNFAPPFGPFAGSVTVYSPGASGNVAPVATITDSTTGIRGIQALHVDEAGSVSVTLTFASTVKTFAPGANGVVAPIATITGPSTEMEGPIGIVVDASERTLVANYNLDTITAYPSGANGDVAPIATITGPATGLAGPTGLALAPDVATPVQIGDSALSDGQSVRVTGTIDCQVGQRFRLEVSVTQAESAARGVVTGTCAGGPRSFRVVAMVTSGPGLETGAAQVDVVGQIGTPGERSVDRTFMDTEEVTLRVL